MIHVRQDPVVVTGVGATTPLGGDVPTTWEALLAGQSGVRRLTLGLAAGAVALIDGRFRRSCPDSTAARWNRGAIGAGST